MLARRLPVILMFILLPLMACSHDDALVDPQGNTYTTVKIGQQQWMAANLLYDVGEGCYCYENDSLQAAEMGRLYTWSAAKAAADQIPGWHLPSRDEWQELMACCGTDTTGYLNLIDPGTGFNPQWSGVRTASGRFQAKAQKSVNYWSSTTADTIEALAYSVAFLSKLKKLSPHNYPKVNACSVRLLKDR